MKDDFNFDQTIIELAQARRSLADAKMAMTDMLDALQLSEAYQAAALQAREATTRLTVLSELIKAAALELYQETGNKNPHPKVVVKVYSEFRYDQDAAISWARVNAPLFLVTSLDEKSFEAYAKNARPDFVSVAERPQAQIASKLD